MAYNSNTAPKIEYVYQNNKLTVVKKMTEAAKERSAYVKVAKVAALAVSITILSCAFVYSHAAAYSVKLEVDDLQETLDFNKSNYTQTLTQFNNIFTEDFVRTYAVEQLGFSSASSSVVYINSEVSEVEVLK